MKETLKKQILKSMFNEGMTSMWTPLGNSSISLKFQINLELYKDGEDVRIIYNQKDIKAQVWRQIKKEIERMAKHKVYSVDSSVSIPFVTRVTLDV